MVSDMDPENSVTGEVQYGRKKAVAFSRHALFSLL